MAKLGERIIEWSFYLIFFLVPLVFYSGSFELFEYNKMMLTYLLTIVIGAAWLIKLVALHGFKFKSWLSSIRRTPLDIPIALYLLSHIISTIFSIDPHTSLWGYYSRSHEGLLATLSYIVLYYAAVSNLTKANVMRIFSVSFVSAVIVSLWGALEHFGSSPSCAILIKQWTNECWIQDVTNRVFATLGQPNWMAAYLDIVILAALGWALVTKRLRYFALAILFFFALLFTKSRSGFLGLITGGTILGASFLLFELRGKVQMNKQLLIGLGGLFASFLLAIFLFGIPFAQLDFLTLNYWQTRQSSADETYDKSIDSGILISESGDIRSVVWQGAIDVWKRYPIFGSGVETFAFSYYLDRPVAHNMLSEWDFLYNKAHNEFLNILATTGTVGMITYLSIIGVFTWWVWKQKKNLLVVTLYAAYASILVTNLLGFSVVIIGLFFFLIPAFCLLLISSDDNTTTSNKDLSIGQWLAVGLVCLVGLIMSWNLRSMWAADASFAYGKNLDNAGRFVEGLPYLLEAAQTNPNEPTFKDELSYNEAVLAVSLYQALEEQATGSAQAQLDTVLPGYGISINDLVNSAVTNSDQVITISPQAMPYWKTRTKTFYQLGTIDPRYFRVAVEAIKRATELAPSDAKVSYNYGLILGQTGQVPEAIKVLEHTIALKPNYRDARYLLGLYYDQVDQKAKAREQMEYIVQKIGNDADATSYLESH